MFGAIKYLFSPVLSLSLLLVSSTQISFAQFSNNESNDSISPKIIKIETFDKFNGTWKDQTYTFRQKHFLEIEKSSTSLKITLAEIDSIYSNQIQYSYRLGSSNPWIELENNIVEIQNILPGKSTLQIRKNRSNGVWSSRQIEIRIFKQQPFYLRYPFIIGVILVVISLLIYFKKWTENQKIKQFPIAESSSREEDKPQKIIIDEWVELVHKNANSLIDQGKFSIIELAISMNLSERQFRRKLKQKTGLRPADYMREIRLLKAKELLINKSFPTVMEVCFAVGFSTPKHFSKIFKERFGEKPSFYLGNKKSS